MIELLSAISLFGTLANIAHAQTTITTTLNGQPTTLELGYFIQPSGVQKVRGSFSDSTPLVCTSVCYAIETVYGGCFLDYKVPFQNGTEEFSTFDYSLEVCTDFFCSGSQYQVFAACMNCIVANGGGTTPDANALPSEWAINRGAAATQVIDQSRAQGWLRNVTDYCAANGVGVGDGEEVTATPTTTGPYSTTWRVRDTVVIPQWTQYTGLTAHVSTIEAQILSGYLYAATATYTDDLPTRTTSPTGTDQTTRTSQTQGGSATSSAPASASTSSYAHRSCGSEWAGALAGGWLMVAWFYAL